LSSASEYDLAECAECAARYFRPMPTADELNNFYSNQYYGGDWYKQQGWGMAFAGSFLRGLPPGRFLDVGCGLGFFLDGIRRHSAWKVCGVEFSPSAVAYANRELELDVRQGELSEVGFPDGHFDYLHVCNVLEHVTDPVRLLGECRRIIKPDGTLHLRVPNGVVDSLDLINFYRSRQRPALSPSGHLFFFPRQTLLRMFDEAGFTVEKALTYGVRRGLRSLGLYPRRGGWEDRHVARDRVAASPSSTDIVLPPKKERPDLYYKYRFLQLRLKMLPGMREFGLDYLLLLRPKT
jgi:SAM-dependent methyltransferase